MKFVAYMMAAVVFLSVLINPIVELLGAFSDMVKINAAVYSSSRAAIMDAENEEETRNVESIINQDKFKERFEEYLCVALNLKESSFESKDDHYNDFKIKYVLDEKDSCTFEVSTVYKFKTGMFKRYFKDLNNAGVLRIRRTQRFEINN